jgi:ribosomal protein S18 acetylase RimI-like enzyme
LLQIYLGFFYKFLIKFSQQAYIEDSAIGYIRTDVILNNMDNLQIEVMVESDLKSVIKIFLEVFNSLGEQWSLETAEKHIKENFFGDCHYIAKLDDKIIGFLLAIPLTRERGTELFIDSVAVQREFQRRGVGKKLWEQMYNYAIEKRYIGIRLLSSRQLQSFHWYQSMNLKESGWVEVYKELYKL